ncbi:hypothetical protein [Flavobacterium sp.]|nr:hypothetical protein [Flavobacterium sp.]
MKILVIRVICGKKNQTNLAADIEHTDETDTTDKHRKKSVKIRVIRG